MKATYILHTLFASALLTACATTIGEENPTDSAASSSMTSSRSSIVSSSSSTTPLHPMAIESLRRAEYPGSDLRIERQLSDGSNFERYVASHLSEGLRINGLLTIPTTEKPEGGFPAVLFVHGYIPPNVYSTINSYPTYQLYLARNGFVTYKPDLRGHDESEGEPSSAHYSSDYVIDSLNAISSVKMHEDVNPERIGYWGHSNGGEIGLRAILVDEDIKAASFWAGVVGSYEDMLETYVDDISFLDAENSLTQRHGMPSANPEFWKTIEPYEYLDEISIPIELQHGTNDASVPLVLSQRLRDELERAGVTVEYTEYQGDNHDIAANASRAWQRTIDFFNRNL